MNCRTRARRSLDREDQVERFTCCRTDWDSKAHVLSMPFLVLRSSEDRNVSISAVSASLRLSAIPSISCRSPRPSKLNRRQSKRAQSPRSFRSHRTVADTGSQGFAMRTDGRDGSRRCGRLIQRACTAHPRQRPVREQSCARSVDLQQRPELRRTSFSPTGPILILRMPSGSTRRPNYFRSNFAKPN